MSEPKAKQIVVEELVSGGHSQSAAEYLVGSLTHFARADALEEAAKVAEDFDDKICGDEILPPSQFDIAAAIRALREKKG